MVKVRIVDTRQEFAMGKDGGTQLWCPNCESVQVCRVDTTYTEADRGNFDWYRDFPVKTFRRPRVCNKCNEFFFTSEVNEDVLQKLFESEDLGKLKSLKVLQQSIDEFAKERDWQQFHTIKNLTLALVGEVGELAELIQWKSESEIGSELQRPKKLIKVSAEDRATLRARFEDELADVFIYLLRLASVSNADLIRAAKFKMQRNRIRYSIEKSKGNADKQ